jgi:hypothetical protein
MASNINSHFLSKDNLSLLFEVIIDEYKNYISDKSAFNSAFNEMIQMFYYNQSKSGIEENINDIVVMNKKFISFISTRIEQKFNIQKQLNPNIYVNNNSNVNNISNVNNNVAVTNEDIKNKRLENFDKELSLKQNEFKNAFNSNIPETPNFTSPLDGPLDEIDVLTKKKLEERENEIQNIYNNIHSGIKNDKKNVDLDFEIKESNEWLQYFCLPHEKKESNISAILKSIKINEEIKIPNFIKEESVLHHNSVNASNIIQKKNISWSDEKRLNTDDTYVKIKIFDEPPPPTPSKENNIFSKLKKIDGGLQNEIDLLSPTPSKVISSIPVPSLSESETIIRLETKIDKLTNDINKCYDIITLLFNTIMSSSNNATNNTTNNTTSEIITKTID